MSEQSSKKKPQYVGAWQFGTQRCPHGRAIPYRWVGDTQDDSEPEFGKNGCKKCDEGLP
jgi:hypothetical protein